MSARLPRYMLRQMRRKSTTVGQERMLVSRSHSHCTVSQLTHFEAPNFISEIFFLACAYSHYGLVPTYTYHESVNRHVDNLRRDLQEMESDRQYDGTPQEGAYKQQVERQKAELEAWRSRVHAAEVQILDPGFIQRVSTYTNFVMTWLVRLVDPKGSHPSREISLDNLPEKTPLAFSMLPEYIVEDVTEFYLFVSRFAPQTMFDLQKDRLVTFVIVFQRQVCGDLVPKHSLVGPALSSWCHG